MNFSFWEQNTWLSNIDFAVIGSGIVGLNCAINLKERYPKAKVLVLERGLLPQGASTKNAGFACFGSVSEILDDLSHLSEDEVVNLVRKRQKGLELLRKNLGDKTINYKNHGGYELFLNSQHELFENSFENLDRVNKLLQPVFNADAFSITINKFGFNKVVNRYIYSPFEGQINTGKMMDALLKLAVKKSVKILNSVEVEAIDETVNGVAIKTNLFELQAKKALVATNGFASRFLAEGVKPARAQVLITKPIESLKIKGTFHIDEGYYYFRNVGNRILFGGGRNLDFKAEETTQFGLTEVVQNRLEALLKTVILPHTDFEIDYRWSGIMAMGKQKKPIVKQVSNNVYCGVRLSGMGIAIGSLIGQELAGLVDY